MGAPPATLLLKKRSSTDGHGCVEHLEGYVWKAQGAQGVGWPGESERHRSATPMPAMQDWGRRLSVLLDSWRRGEALSPVTETFIILSSLQSLKPIKHIDCDEIQVGPQNAFDKETVAPENGFHV